MAVNFTKGILVSVGGTATVLSAVLTVGLLGNFGSGGHNEPAEPQRPRTVIMNPVALDLSGYDLKRNRKDDLVFASISMVVQGGREQAAVCRLMPRLRAIVVRDLGFKLRSRGTGKKPEGQDYDEFVLGRFRHTLGSGVLDRVSVAFVPDQHRAPAQNCPDPDDGRGESRHR